MKISGTKFSPPECGPQVLRRRRLCIESLIRAKHVSRTLGSKMTLEKILVAIDSSISHLEDSVEASEKDKETKVMSDVWQAAADLEYALFLFSLMHQNAAKPSSWKTNPRSKQDEMKPLLASTKDLLETAKESLKTKNLLEAYKKAWIARGHLLRIHDAFEKKRKSAK